MSTILSQNDAAVLSSYAFRGKGLSLEKNNRKENDWFLAVENIEGKKQLTKIHRSDLTVWSIIKGFFGKGALANKEYKISQVASYLENTYQKNLSKLDPEDSSYQTIHAIATRLIAYRKSGDTIPGLWSLLATEEKPFVFYRENVHERAHKTGLIKPYYLPVAENKHLFPVTAKTTAGHIVALGRIVEKETFFPFTKSAVRQSVSDDSQALDTLFFTVVVNDSQKEPLDLIK